MVFGASVRSGDASHQVNFVLLALALGSFQYVCKVRDRHQEAFEQLHCPDGSQMLVCGAQGAFNLLAVDARVQSPHVAESVHREREGHLGLQVLPVSATSARAESGSRQGHVATKKPLKIKGLVGSASSNWRRGRDSTSPKNFFNNINDLQRCAVSSPYDFSYDLEVALGSLPRPVNVRGKSNCNRKKASPEGLCVDLKS